MAPPRSKAAQIVYALSIILVGCVLNNVVLEVIVTDKNPWADKKAGALLTFLQYSLVALLTLPDAFAFSNKNGVFGILRKPTVVPLRHYVQMAGLFAVMSMLNNIAFAFHISQPLHMVFRSANLMVTYAFGRVLFGKRYTSEAFLSVLILTAGAACNTVAEAMVGDTAKRSAAAAASGTGAAGCTGVGCGGAAPVGGDMLNLTAASEAERETGSAYMVTWAIGVGILTAVLCLQSVLSEYQNWAGRTYGRAPTEGTFYMHTFSLPVLLALMVIKFDWSIMAGFGIPFPLPVITFSDIINRVALWSSSPPAAGYLADVANGVTGSGWPVQWSATITHTALSLIGCANMPVLWLFVSLNVITQYICIRGVYELISVSDPLTVNVALTVRKAVSVVVSIAIFNNTFTAYHWLGAALVFGGAFYFTQSPAGGLLPSTPSCGAAGTAASSSSAKATIMSASTGTSGGPAASKLKKTASGADLGPGSHLQGGAGSNADGGSGSNTRSKRREGSADSDISLTTAAVSEAESGRLLRERIKNV